MLQVVHVKHLSVSISFHNSSRAFSKVKPVQALIVQIKFFDCGPNKKTKRE